MAQTGKDTLGEGDVIDAAAVNTKSPASAGFFFWPIKFLKFPLVLYAKISDKPHRSFYNGR